MTNQLPKIKDFRGTKSQENTLKPRKSLRNIALDAKTYDKHNVSTIDKAFEKSLDKAQKREVAPKERQVLAKNSDVEVKKDAINTKGENTTVERRKESSTENVKHFVSDDEAKEESKITSKEALEEEKTKDSEASDALEVVLAPLMAGLSSKETEVNQTVNPQENLEQLLPQTSADKQASVKNSTLLSMLSGTLFTEKIPEKNILSESAKNLPSATNTKEIALDSETLTQNTILAKGILEQLPLSKASFKNTVESTKQPLVTTLSTEPTLDKLDKTFLNSIPTQAIMKTVPNLENILSAKEVQNEPFLQNVTDMRMVLAENSENPLTQVKDVPANNTILGFAPSLLNTLRTVAKNTTTLGEAQSQQDLTMEGEDNLKGLFKDIPLQVETHSSNTKAGDNSSSAFFRQSSDENLINLQALSNPQNLASNSREDIISPFNEALNLENKTNTEETSVPFNPLLVNGEQKITEALDSAKGLATKRDYEITKQIIEQVKILKNNQNSEMLIRLKPAHLGDLSLRIALRTDGKVSAIFHSNNAETRGILETSMIELKQELQKVGLKVDSIEVSTGLAGDTLLGGGAGENYGEAYQGRQRTFTNTAKDMQTLSDDLETIDSLQEGQTLAKANLENGVDYLV